MASVLRVKDNDGNIIDIPAIKGDKGDAGSPPKKGDGNPTEETAADFVGQIYIDEKNTTAYICVSISDGFYTWNQITFPNGDEVSY